MKFYARGIDERIVFENREAFEHRVEVLLYEELVVFVMADSAKVARKLAKRDRLSLIGEAWDVLLYWRVEIELVLLCELDQDDRSNRFGYAADAKFCRGFGRNMFFKVGEPESFGINNFAIVRDSDGKTRNSSREPLIRDRAGMLGGFW